MELMPKCTYPLVGSMRKRESRQAADMDAGQHIGGVSLLAENAVSVYQASSFSSSHYEPIALIETREKREKSLLLCDTRHFLYSPCNFGPAGISAATS